MKAIRNCYFTLLFLAFAMCMKGQESKKLVILDNSNRSPVAFAHIINTTNITGTISNESGHAKVTVSDTAHVFKISCIGFETRLISGSKLFNCDTVFLWPQVRVMDEVLVQAKKPNARKIIRQALKKYKDRPSTTNKAFEGYFEEVFSDSTGIYSLRSVFAITGYDNQSGVDMAHLFSYEGKIALVALEKDSIPKLRVAVNGLRWVTKNSKVRHAFAFRWEWDDVIIDSVTLDSDRYDYWISVYSKKGFRLLQTVITDSFDVKMIETYGIFAKKMVFDPAISFEYPVYAECRHSYPKTDLFRAHEATYRMFILRELESFPYREGQCMPGEAMHDEEAKSMWQQKALKESFDWGPYEGL